MAMKYLKLLCTKDKHPHLHDEKALRKILLKCTEPPPKNLFYDIVTKAQTMKLY